MAKRSTPSVSSDISNGVAIDPVVSYTKPEPSVMNVVSKFPATINIRGQVTGKLYVWAGSGAIVEVAAEDVEDLLTKKIGNSTCCGSSNQQGNLLFEVV